MPLDQSRGKGRIVLVLAIVAASALVVVTAFGDAAMEYFTPFLFGPVWGAVMLGFAAIAIWSLIRLRHIRREGWSAVLPAVVCGVAVATLIALPLPGPHPTDDDMIRDFTQHRQGYTTLLRMFEEDPKLGRLGDLAGDWPENPADAGVDSARLARYRALMRDLGVESLERSKGRVLFIMSTYGLSVSGSSKSYLYSDTPPAPLVGDTERDADGPTGEVYRHIEGNWYIVYEWDA